jgi:alpha-glucuronidase
MNRIISIYFFLFFLIEINVHAENGYDLWLRYHAVQNTQKLMQYKSAISSVYIAGNGSTINVVKNEMSAALNGLLGKTNFVSSVNNASVFIGTASALSTNVLVLFQKELQTIGDEGFIIATKKINNQNKIIITANTDAGILYGAFQFIKLLQTQEDISNLNIVSKPSVKLRLLNHWDNLNRTVERGYAGFSIWKWHTLPDYIDDRYVDYARANASIGINGTALTNVNANAKILTQEYLQKVKALANVFRPYHIKVYLTARFSAPIEIGNLKTADPLDENVQKWWQQKADEIYSLIPDFGGFLVKANSEGQPGPQDYNRTHADGANMLADVLAPHGGIVMWRAFVYSAEIPDDRHKQAYNEFVPLDGKFKNNVMVQVKNGAIDFMPREPFHPLFGAMPKTPLIPEFQITQEYLGQGTHLVFLAPLFKECLDSDTWYKGKGSTVAKILDGSLDGQKLTGIAGVANIGTDINWTGHPFAQANWFAFGRLSWNDQITSEQIAYEWIRMTFTNDDLFVKNVKNIMLRSREILVDYMNPIGLHHIMATNHHYGPAPWVNNLPRADWNPVYYHRADKNGIGFDRTANGSNAIAQYYPNAAKQWENPATIDEKYLLWFHHLPWNYKMKSGRNLWEELCYKYNAGVDSVKWMQQIWSEQKGKIDEERFNAVTMLLSIQLKEAKWWRDACLSYFQTFSGMPIPSQYPQPEKSLEYYKGLNFPFAPGINGTN